MNTPAIPAEFWQGIEQFNQHQFYACHDTLEALWMESGEPDRTFYQGILQVAVALYHLHQKNWRGAVILLGEGINRLRRYEPEFFDIDVEQLVTESGALLTHLQQRGPEKVADLLTDPSLPLPTIALVSSVSSDSGANQPFH